MKEVTVFFENQVLHQFDGVVYQKYLVNGAFVRIKRKGNVYWYIVYKTDASCNMTPINLADVPPELRTWELLLQ